MNPELRALAVADPPQRWEALGFSVLDGVCSLGGVAIRLGCSGSGIVGWSVSGADGSVDGLPVCAEVLAVDAEHPNGAIGLDHVVVLTPDFERTAESLDRAGMPLRRVVGKMGFRRLGPAILELVARDDVPPGSARFWGLVVIVSDLDALAARLGDRLSEIRDAVQPGRRIATLRPSADLSAHVAFMDPEN
jgi:hypothetical protein